MIGSSPSWQALQGGIAGDVVLPGSPGDQQLRKPFNARFHDVPPRAIVLCATPRTSLRRSRSHSGMGWRALLAAAVTALPGAR